MVRLSLIRSIFSTSLVLVFSVTVAGKSLASTVSVSNNLPVPNYISGATLNYINGTTNNGSFTSNTGSLSSSAQTTAATAANKSQTLNIDLGTTSNNVADLRYNSFNVGYGYNVNYNFGASGQVAINTVTQTGSQYVSNILGSITQTGQGGAVFVINPNGILFGKNSTINVGSFTASTLNQVSNTFSDPTSKVITFSRGTQSPTGMILQNGANITASNGVSLISNGILDQGANISASNGNVQLVTCDGASFTYFYDFENSLSQSSFTPATVTPGQVSYPNKTTNSVESIYVNGGSISGENVSVSAELNKQISSPLNDIINLDGVITAIEVSNSGGYIYISASDTNTSNNVKAVNSTHLNSFTEQIKADNNIYVTASGGAGIETGNLTSSQDINISVTNGSYISTGNISTGGNLKTYDYLSYLNMQNITSNDIYMQIGAGDTSLSSGAAGVGYTTIGNINAVSLTGNSTGTSNNNNFQLKTGNITLSQDLDIDAHGHTHNETYTGNITTGGDLTISQTRGQIVTGTLNSGGNVTLSTTCPITTKNITAVGNVIIGDLIGSTLYKNRSITTGVIKAGGEKLLESNSLHTQ